MSSISSITVETFQITDVSDEMLTSAATLFSSSYGTWGPQVASKMESSYKEGHAEALYTGAPIKMSPARLREQCLPPNTPSIHIRATLPDGLLVGYAFATTWTYLDRRVCWITQLCVARPLRSQGLATKILRHLRAGNRDHGYGILSSHPHAILAALRALGRGIEGGVHLQSVKMRLRGFMDESPVVYVKKARLRGSLFGDEDSDGSVCCADTGFWVDQKESVAALEQLKKKGVKWPFGELLEGCEFVVLIRSAEVHKEARLERKEKGA